MGIWSWLTGHDEKESDLYANYGMVDEVTKKINNVATVSVANAEQEFNAAMARLNNAKGMTQYVAQFDAARFSEVFSSLSDSIRLIGTQINEKAENIKRYEEAPFLEKVGSTIAMGVFKIGEGLLSVAEDIGDGVVSVVGWLAPKDSGLENWCSDFVKKEWSHDAFNFYYKSDFAKASFFTEDSAIMSGCKIVGSSLGYLALGGAISGMAGAAAQSSKAGKLLKSIGTFAQSTTRTNTVIAAISGLGAGTESGLNQGLSFDQSFGNGVKTGAINAGIAFAAGKLGEKRAATARDKAIAEAQNSIDDIERGLQESADVMKNAKESAEQFVADAQSGKYIGTREDAIQQIKNYSDIYNAANERGFELAGQLDKANEALTAAQNMKIQGYSDSITKAGQRWGENYAHTVGSQGFLKGTASTMVSTAGSAVSAGKSAAKNFVSAIAHPKTSIPNAINGVKSAASSVKGALANPGTTLKNIGSAAGEVLKSAATPGVVSAIATTAIRDRTKATGIQIKTDAASAEVQLASRLTGTSATEIARDNYYKGKDYKNKEYTGFLRSSNELTEGSSGVQFRVDDVNFSEDGIGRTEPTASIVDRSSTQESGNTFTETPTTEKAAPAATTQTAAAPQTTSSVPIEPLVTTPTASTPATITPTSQPQTQPAAEQQTQLRQTEPVTIEPTKQTEPVTTEPMKKTDPVTIEPTKKPDPVTTEPTKKPDPVTTEPIKQTKPVTTEPTKQTDPITTDTTTNKRIPQIYTPSTSSTYTTGGIGTGTSTGSGSSSSSGNGKTGSGLEASAATKKNSLDDLTKKNNKNSSINDAISSSKNIKLPSSTKPIQSSSSAGTNAAIPVAAGLSIAAAAGIGAKAYLDKKKENEEESEEFYDEEFSEDDIENEDWTPNIDELEVGTADLDALGFADNDAASETTYDNEDLEGAY